MRVFTELKKLPAFRNGVLTIGSFDGVHFGHQQIISRLNTVAGQIGGESIVLTFDPHPRLVLNPEYTGLRLLTPLKEKIRLLTGFGAKNVVVAPFTLEFSQLSAEAYVRDFLVRFIRPHTIIIGYDHQFGKGRDGNLRLLAEIGKEEGFLVEEIPARQIDDIAVSSTKIRLALQQGDVQMASRLLGYPYFMDGRVVPGNRLGTTIGFPTANIEAEDRLKLIPGDGVYAVRAVIAGKTWNGMANIGIRPTFGKSSRTVECHLFDFSQTIYDQTITVEFHARIRDERQFASPQELAIQLENDRQIAMSFLHS